MADYAVAKGDTILTTVGARLRENLPSETIAARLGGTEMAVLRVVKTADPLSLGPGCVVGANAVLYCGSRFGANALVGEPLPALTGLGGDEGRAAADRRCRGDRVLG